MKSCDCSAKTKNDAKNEPALMKHDNVVAKTAFSLEGLGVTPTALEDILPGYSF